MIKIITEVGELTIRSTARYAKPVSMETTEELLRAEHHYEQLAKKEKEEDQAFAYIIVQPQIEAPTYVNGVGLRESMFENGYLNPMKVFDHISDNSHDLVEKWIPEIEQKLEDKKEEVMIPSKWEDLLSKEEFRLKASWADGSKELYGEG